jgi:hypothetical protein
MGKSVSRVPELSPPSTNRQETVARGLAQCAMAPLSAGFRVRAQFVRTGVVVELCAPGVAIPERNPTPLVRLHGPLHKQCAVIWRGLHRAARYSVLVTALSHADDPSPPQAHGGSLFSAVVGSIADLGPPQSGGWAATKGGNRSRFRG